MRTIKIDPRSTMVDASSRLTVFAFIWASQVLVHQAFFPVWIEQGSIFGWLVTIFALATLLFPRSLVFLSGLLLFNLIYNFGRWPSVANHIFLEFLVELTILLAILISAYQERRRDRADNRRMRDDIFDRFSPVLIAMLIAVYYIIFLSKLNWDFINIDLSCVSGMYQDVIDRFSPLPLPTDRWAMKSAVSIFLAVELLVPLCLTFRRTRYLGMIIALPLHLLLGLIGHWTFSALVFGLYAVICIGPLTKLIGDLQASLPTALIGRSVKVVRTIVPVLTAILIVTFFVGDYTEATGPFYIFRFDFHVWFLWSCLVGLTYVVAVLRTLSEGLAPQIVPPPVRPGWLWMFVGLVILNGLSPYLGLKTESSFAMYSNLRTEGGINNHMFMPALRLASYQDDLVTIVETDHPAIKKMSYWHPLGDQTRTPRNKFVPYFELRRIVSETESDFYVTYVRNKKRVRFESRDGVASDPQLAQRLSFWSAKLLFFRPVFSTEESLCQH